MWPKVNLRSLNFVAILIILAGAMNPTIRHEIIKVIEETLHEITD